MLWQCQQSGQGKDQFWEQVYALYTMSVFCFSSTLSYLGHVGEHGVKEVFGSSALGPRGAMADEVGSRPATEVPPRPGSLPVRGRGEEALGNQGLLVGRCTGNFLQVQQWACSQKPLRRHELCVTGRGQWGVVFLAFAGQIGIVHTQIE